ncbi:hypothetical protein [Roseovarius pacificus]|uniref:hypothetical protein n=1 Tax=Roseovarius pacificus TaxID=337701 RepID=UPI002A186C23|nr:hypothetical protein [Roseovarius pacificus]
MSAFDLYADFTEAELANLSAFDRAALIAEAEALRIEAVKARGHVPPECGDRIPHAPARGAIRVFEGVTLYPDGEDGWKPAPSGHMGRKTMARADAFDVMEAKARKRLFSPGQKAMGRFYGALYEAHMSAGVQCASLEARVDRSGSGGGEFIDAVLRDRQRLDVLRARIGDGVAMRLRKQRPSARGSRVSIPDRRLVDAVCIEGRTLSEVLSAAGWAVTGKARAALRAALCDALERMMGPQHRGRIVTARYEGCE